MSTLYSNSLPLIRLALLFLIIETQNDYVRFHGKAQPLSLAPV